MTTASDNMTMFDRSGTVRRPAPTLVVRELIDFFSRADRAGAARLLATAPRGDGHPVLVIPALLKDDRATAFLRAQIEGLGYCAHRWRLGTNIGPTDIALDGSLKRLLELRRRHARPVTVIGHSMGGLIAREIAKRAPGSVRQVITLCSPFRPPVATNVETVFRLLSRYHSARVPELWASMATKPPVPTTAIYTKTDGIVSWQSCCDDPGDRYESIEVAGWHTTMARNLAALAIIADRLALPEGTWRPYASSRENPR
jgi:pimeloyl-ACP methyl ester carboxylesterase